MGQRGRIHQRIAHQRGRWLHKLTTDLTDRDAVIAVEDLRIKNMSAGAKRTAAEPGNPVRQKAELNRGILDAAWGEFTRQRAYKTQWRGGGVVLIDPAYTSRTCRICTVRREPEDAERLPMCGLRLHREHERTRREEHSGQSAGHL